MLPLTVLIFCGCLILGKGLENDDKYGSGSEFFEAIRNGDLKAVEKLIASKANVNAQNSEGVTPLHTAAHFGRFDLVDTLLKNGANVSITAQNNETALCEAVAQVEKIENQDKIVELLLQNGAKDDLAIFVAANRKGREKALELLIKYGADVNVNRGKNTPLFVADGPKAAEILIAAGADVNAVNEYGRTPLMDDGAIWEEDVLKVLIKHGADVNYRGYGGSTPLHRAARANYVSVQILIENGANVNLTDSEGFTALMGAFDKKYEKSVEVLLKAGISREIIAGVTALHLAASTGLEKIAKMLIETGSDVNPVALDGSTPLHVAALEGREKVVQLLLENGADTNRLNNLGQTALVVAKQKGHKNIVDILEKVATSTKSE